MSEKIASAASKLSQNAPQRFMSIYDRLKAVKSPDLDPLLYILHAYHLDHKSPLKQSTGDMRATPKLKSNLSSGSLKQIITPHEKETPKFVSDVKETPKSLPFVNYDNAESKVTPSLARSIAKSETPTAKTPKLHSTPASLLLDRDFVGSLKVNSKTNEGKEKEAFR